MKKVNYQAPISEINEKDEYEVIFLQGKRYQVRRGEDVEIPKAVADVSREANKYNASANKQMFVDLSGQN